MDGLKAYKKKLPDKSGRMKKVARTKQTIVTVEIVLKPVEVQIPLLAVPVEVNHIAVAVAIAPVVCKTPSIPLPLEYSRSCILFGVLKPTSILHRVSSFLEIKLARWEKPWPLPLWHSLPRNSAAGSHNRRQIRLVSEFILILFESFEKKIKRPKGPRTK